MGRSVGKSRWLAAGQYTVTALSVHKIPSKSSRATVPIATAHFKLLESWSADAPKEFSTQFTCGAGATELCHYSLKAGGVYGLILNRASWSTARGFAWPLNGEFVNIAPQGLFEQNANGGWSNVGSGGGIGTKSIYSVTQIKDLVGQALLEVQLTGRCTSDIGPDSDTGVRIAPPISRKANWPVPTFPKRPGQP